MLNRARRSGCPTTGRGTDARGFRGAHLVGDLGGGLARVRAREGDHEGRENQKLFLHRGCFECRRASIRMRVFDPFRAFVWSHSQAVKTALPCAASVVSQVRCLRPPARHSPPRATREVGSVRKRACLVRDSPLGDFRTPARAEACSPIRASPRPAHRRAPLRADRIPTNPSTAGAPPPPKPWERAAATGESVSASTPAAPGDAPKPWDVPGAGSAPSGTPPRPTPPRVSWRPQFPQLYPRADEPNLPPRAPRLTLPSTRSPPHLPQRRYRRHLTPREPPRRRRRGTASREPR